MFKKLLLVTLTAFTFIGLTGCGNDSGKKLTAEEAKAEIKKIEDNTEKAIKENKGITFNEKSSAKGEITLKNIKMSSEDTSEDDSLEIKSGKFSASLEENLGFTFDREKLDVKANGDAKGSISYSFTAADETIKNDCNFDANGEIYLINGSEKDNIYAKSNANLPKKENINGLFELLEYIPYDSSEYYFYISLINQLVNSQYYSEKYNGAINLKLKKDEIEGLVDYDIDGAISQAESYIPSGYSLPINVPNFDKFDNYEFSSLIKDWSIFSKNGSTLTADCSNLAAFDLKMFNIDANTEAILAALGLELKISKFEIKVNDNNELTSFDFNIGLKGNIDLAKIDEESSGKISVDCSLGLGFDVTYSTTNPTITVPEALVTLKETTIEDLFPSNNYNESN